MIKRLAFPSGGRIRGKMFGFYYELSSILIRPMCQIGTLSVAATLALSCAANELEKYAVYPDAGIVNYREELVQHGVWVTGDVINDPKEGLMFRTDKPVEGNTTGKLVCLAVT